MKIIKEGKIPEDLMLSRCFCSVCGCIFECHEHELRHERTQFNEYVCCAYCPTCSAKTYAIKGLSL
jgi:hypothetical protein